MLTATVPSRSVRNTREATCWRRAIVDRAGWPYELPAPTDTTAIDGRVASRKGAVVDVAEP